jgi:uncharacterized protein (TIGR02598 family)
MRLFSRIRPEKASWSPHPLFAQPIMNAALESLSSEFPAVGAPAPRSVRNRRGRGAFSLIEVVVAVGIVATVFVALMGMIPIGIDTMKDAGEITMRSQIAQKLIGELQLVEWRPDGGSGDSVIVNYDGEKRYYDEFGLRVDNQGDGLYTALVEVNPDPVILPNTVEGNEFMKQVSVKVAYTPPGFDVDFSDDIVDPDYSRFSAIVSDLKLRGQDLR